MRKDLQLYSDSKKALFNFREIWEYRDLLFLLVKRDFISLYKQTILGPLWFFIQPLLTTVTYIVIFGNIAGISTDGLPKILFYLAGITCWGYFSESFTKTSDTFISNAGIFGKVYFPRLIIPLSIVFSSLIRFFIQLFLFLLIWIYFLCSHNSVHPNTAILLLPFLLILMAGLALGCGIIISSLTIRYRDLRFLLAFGIQLLMFATPVIFPLSAMTSKYKWIVKLNPLTPVVETFRYAFLGSGSYSADGLLYSFSLCIILIFLGILIFNRVEKSFIDTI